MVTTGIREISFGQTLSSGHRRLICYAVWGNPSDAYKWYEYHLQEEYLPHRYLPEHVVLGHLPKLAGDAVPQPSSLHRSGRHKGVRYRMARANDEGIGESCDGSTSWKHFLEATVTSCICTDYFADVLEVLLTEFKAALIRRGFRRADINTMYEHAKTRLENERQDPTGMSSEENEHEWIE